MDTTSVICPLLSALISWIVLKFGWAEVSLDLMLVVSSDGLDAVTSNGKNAPIRSAGELVGEGFNGKKLSHSGLTTSPGPVILPADFDISASMVDFEIRETPKTRLNELSGVVS